MADLNNLNRPIITDLYADVVDTIRENIKRVQPAAGTIPGATLAANVLASSLTSVGVLSTLAVTGALFLNGQRGTASQVLHGNPAGAPTFSAVNLASDVTGLLPLANLAALPPFTGRNGVRNGAQDVWQRGTSFTNVSTTNFYTSDGYGANRAGDAVGVSISRITDAPPGFRYSLKFQRAAANTDVGPLSLYYANETANSVQYAGRTVCFSVYAKPGANCSAAGLGLSLNLYYGTGTDQRMYAFTGATSVASGTPVMTAGWARYSITGSVPANATEIGFSASWTPVGTAGADDSVYLTGFQLEPGSTPTPFDFVPYETTLARCQRYLPIINAASASSFACGPGLAASTTGAYCLLPLGVRPRVPPTGVIVSSPSHFFIYNGTASITATALAFSDATYESADVLLTVASGLTVGQAAQWGTRNAAGQLQFTGCEL